MTFEEAAKKRGLTILSQINEECYYCTSETSGGEWYCAAYIFDEVDDTLRRTRDLGDSFTVDELSRFPPVAALLAACENDVIQLANLARMVDPELTDQYMESVYATIAKMKGTTNDLSNS